MRSVAAMWLILLLALRRWSRAVVISSWMPDRYKATASIVKQVTTGPYESVNVDALTRELSTIEQLLLTSDVLDRAAKRSRARRPGRSRRLARVERRPRGEPDLRHRHRRRSEEGRADRNAVATTFIAAQRAVTRQQYEQARAGPRAGARPGPRPAGRRPSRCRRSSSGCRSSASRSPERAMDLQIAQRATPPSDRSSPKPLRNGVIALFLGLFVGVLVALASDQLVPRVTGTRELSRLMDLPVLGTVPYVRRRLSGGRRRAHRDRVRELPDPRHVDPLRARRRSRARTSC